MSTSLTPVLDVGHVRYAWRTLDSRGYCDSGTWSHPGLAAADDGSIVILDAEAAELLELNPDARPRRRVPVPVGAAHGITRVTTPKGDRYWLADNGAAARASVGTIARREWPGQVVEVDRGGHVGRLIETPRHPAYATVGFHPTSVVEPEPDVGSGRIALWVSDGYGASLVLGFDEEGGLRAVLDRSSSASPACREHDALNG